MKRKLAEIMGQYLKSLPSRERELKQVRKMMNKGEICVAPFAGARVETTVILNDIAAKMSLPSRERELKHLRNLTNLFHLLSLPSRERELKRRVRVFSAFFKRRSLRGSAS